MNGERDKEQPSTIGLKTMTSAIESADNYVRWILNMFGPYIGPRLLEVGTGYANFRRVLTQVKEYESCDIDPEVVERARILDPQGRYFQADIAADDFIAKAGRGDFDTVLCVNVLEHIETPEKAVANLMRVLRPGGHLLLFVPAFPGLFSSLDRLAGHYRRFTRKSLADLVGPHGQVVRLEYFNPVGGLGWLVNKFIGHNDIDSAGMNTQVSLFDRYLVPISRAVNPLTRSVFGQSLISVVKKT